MNPEQGLRRRVAHVMGMPISLAVRAARTPEGDVDAAWQDALQVLQEADRVFSTYRPDSVISRLGRGEITVADCPADVLEVLELGERARVESGGGFDVRRRAAGGRLTLDPSGVVKGWAVDRAARVLETELDADFCLSAGGDLLCRTRLAGSAPWRIGIEDPFDTGRVLAVVPVRNGAVATSGTAHRGAHIVDGRTGRTPTGIASVTVVGPDLVWADIDATAAFALGREGLRWLESRGRSGLVVRADRSTALVDGMRARRTA